MGIVACHRPEELDEKDAAAPTTPTRKKNRSDQQDEEPPWKKNRSATTSKHIGPAIAAAEPPPPEEVDVGGGPPRGGGPPHVPSRASIWIARSPAKSIDVLPKSEPKQPPVADPVMAAPFQFTSAPWRSGVAILPPPPKAPQQQPGPHGWKARSGEPWRPGNGGGKARYGISGGKNRDWHRLASRAKRQGAEAYAKYREQNPHPHELRQAWQLMTAAFPKQ